MSLIIDAGHQGVGFDPGAVGNGIIEADLVLDISLYQYERFKQLKVPVQLTRTKTQKLTNAQRTALVKKSGAKHCISNHINAGGGDGAEVIHSIHAKPTFAQTVLDALVTTGQNPRRVFTRTSATSKHDYYYMHRDTGAVETIIVEYGFLDSKKDDVHQLKNDWKQYAEAVVKAYCEYAGYAYVAPKTSASTAKPQNDISDKIGYSNTDGANVFRIQSGRMDGKGDANKAFADAKAKAEKLIRDGEFGYVTIIGYKE